MDIGANFGFYTVILAKNNPNQRVVAIEPNGLYYNLLVRNIRLNQLNNVIPLNFACWDREDILLFRTPKLGEYYDFHADKDGNTRVKARALDSVVNELNLAPTLLKIDVEGAEARVLKSGGQTLQKYKPTIVFEATPATIGACSKILFDLGYGVYRLKDGNWLARPRPSEC